MSNNNDTHVANVEEYKKKCDIIKKLVITQYMYYSIKFEQSNPFTLMYVIINSEIKLAIMPDTKWNELKHDIDLGLKQSYTKMICEECKESIKCVANCNRCKKSICVECYINNFKNGLGIIKCKFCSYSFGHIIHEDYIDLAIDDIRNNAKLKK